MSRLILLWTLFFQLYLGAESIGIVTYHVDGVGQWDDASATKGIAGSEEAVIYLSRALVKLGYEVVIVGNPPENSSFTNPESNPRYIPFARQQELKVDHAVSWRVPYNAEILRKQAKHVYFWPHDTPPQNHIADKYASSFDEVFWLSEWQRQIWINTNVHYERYRNIYGNGIDPEQFNTIQERENPYALVYGSNYARGLEILLDIWPTVKKEFPEATLDIFYGWKHWGLLSPAQEEKMRRQIKDFGSCGVKEWGCVGHEELNRAYERCSIWAYPCIAPETFCITALRAQYAGLYPVIIKGSALHETVQFGSKCDRPDEYLGTLIEAMKKITTTSTADRIKARKLIEEKYTWDVIAMRWKEVFSQNQ